MGVDFAVCDWVDWFGVPDRSWLLNLLQSFADGSVGLASAAPLRCLARRHHEHEVIVHGSEASIKG
jgi:hypothetical protein